MPTARCCPADCALRSDWEDELRREKDSLESDTVRDMDRIINLLAHPLRLRIVLMLLNRDHCVCEFFHVFAEPRNLISYNLRILKNGGLIDSYYRSKYRIYRLQGDAVPAIRGIVGNLPENR